MRPNSFSINASALITWFPSLLSHQANCRERVLLDGGCDGCGFVLCFALVLLVGADALAGVAFLILCLPMIFFAATLLDDDTKGDICNDGQSG